MSDKSLSIPNEILWAVIGLLLTIGGTFLEVHITNLPWRWNQDGIQTYALGVTYQIGAVLLVGCMGGKNAGALSQIAYLVLGLIFYPVFGQGGGLGYLNQPTFGYVLGFIFGAWICGFLAFKNPPKLEFLSLACLCGLFTIHISGLTYICVTHFLTKNTEDLILLWDAIMKYSIHTLPGQLVILCSVTVISYLGRHLLFY